MKKYTEACSPSTDTLRVAHNAGGSNGQAGIVEELIWTTEDFRIDSVTAAKDIDTINEGIAIGKVIVIGKVKPESLNTDATFAEDAELNEKELDTEATRSTGYQSKNCACTHAELLRMNGVNGRLIERTKKGFLKLRYDDEGKLMGMLTSEFYVGLKTTPVSGTPIAYTPFTATFSDGEGDDKAPAEVKVDWSYKDLDAVERAEGVIDTVASNGSSLTFNLTLTQGCSDAVISGAVKDNFTVSDIDGTDISTFTVSETGSTGVYAVDVTTDKTVVYIDIDSVQEISNVLYLSDTFKASV